MGVNTSVRLLAEPLRSLAFGSIGATYMGVGTAFNHPIRIVQLQNLSNQVVIFSFDGVDDHVAVPSNGFLLLDVAANKSEQGGNWVVGQGDRIYVKEDTVTPTSGSVYVTSFYAKE